MWKLARTKHQRIHQRKEEGMSWWMQSNCRDPTGMRRPAGDRGTPFLNVFLSLYAGLCREEILRLWHSRAILTHPLLKKILEVYFLYVLSALNAATYYPCTIFTKSPKCVTPVLLPNGNHYGKNWHFTHRLYKRTAFQAYLLKELIFLKRYIRVWAVGR